MSDPPPRDWDAASYQRVSIPQEEWARSVLDRLDLAGDERVLDAGCGSGRVTSMLIERLPEGSVVALDGSPSMIDEVRSVLRPQDEALVCDLTALELEEPVDIVFSNAVFHWVIDQDALFRSMRRALRHSGSLVSQSGGVGNVERLRASSREVAGRAPYASHFEGFGEPWNFAAPEETEQRLRAAGFSEARAWLQPWDVTPPQPAEFVRTVCLGPHMDRLPEELRDRFVADVLALEDEPLVLAYVRLNIEARADG